MTPAEKYEERVNLIEDTIALKETPRVVNAIRVNSYPYYEYGVTIRESITDYEKAAEAYIRFHKEFQPDVASPFAAQVSAPVLENMDVKCLRWAGHGLSENSTIQFIEYPTIEDDEYEEFFTDPAGFAYRKWLPRMAGVFEPFSKIDYVKLMTSNYRGPQNTFLSPALVESYRKLIAAYEEQQKFMLQAKKCIIRLKEEGFPPFSGGTSIAAFDMLADCLRGTFGIMVDLVERPEIVKKCCDIFVKFSIQLSLDAFKASGNKFQWIVLHKGFDNFISDEMYGEFYWPYLQQWILSLVENGLVPVVFCEGPYTTRLKYLREVPKGKVIYYFENVDMKLAKKALEGTACIMGGFPLNLVSQGTPDAIRDKVKEYMDIMAPGGGYMFGLSASLESAPRANVEALFEAVELYGKK